MFKWLLHFDAVRGGHSTGIAAINRDNNVNLYKEVGHPDDLYRAYEEDFDEDRYIKEYNLKALIGHNRFATTGAKTAENAHPFHHEHIVGAHNGTLQGVHRLYKGGTFEVDSEAIFYNFAEKGFEETMPNLQGAWALTWFNGEDNTMNFIHNKDRPLYYTFDKSESCMYWASAEWMLNIAAVYSKIQIQDVDEFEINKKYSMSLDKAWVKDNDFTESDELYEGYKYTASTNSPGNFWKGHSNFFEGAAKSAASATNDDKKSSLPVFLTPDVSDQEIEKMRSYLGKEIEFFTNGEYQDELGCSFFAAESAKTDEYWEIRVYHSDDKKATQWRSCIGGYSYTATVKKIVRRTVRGKPLVYMLLDMRTISQEIPWDTPTDDKNFLEKGETTTTGGHTTADSSSSGTFWDPAGKFVGYQDKEMDYEEFLRATHSGCNWCGDTAFNVHPPESLVWVAPMQFICPTCNHDNVVKQVYPHLR